MDYNENFLSFLLNTWSIGLVFPQERGPKYFCSDGICFLLEGLKFIAADLQ